MRPFLLWRSDWPVVGQHLCSILFCVACSGALGASLSTMRAFSIMRLSVFCCARWVEGIFSFIDCCWSTLRMCRQKLIPVLCIDEFERIGSKEEFSLDFFEGLRAMA